MYLFLNFSRTQSGLHVDVAACKQKLKNIEATTKKKVQKVTGGGRPMELTIAERTWMEFLKEKRSTKVQGVPGGLETGRIITREECKYFIKN